jgi:hypothetical protein
MAVWGAPDGEKLLIITDDGSWKTKPRKVCDAVVKRYSWHAWCFVPHSLIRGGIDKVHIGLEIKPAG